MSELKRGMNKASIYVSMERNMKCALGYCGHCQFGPTFICRDGPVFPYNRLACLPGKRGLIVFGVVGRSVDVGEPLSPEVKAAIDYLVDGVVQERKE